MMNHFKAKSCFTNSLFPAPRGPATNTLKGWCNLKMSWSIAGTLVPQILSSFSSDVELNGTGLGSFFYSGSEGVFGRLLPNCICVESDHGADG